MATRPPADVLRPVLAAGMLLAATLALDIPGFGSRKSAPAEPSARLLYGIDAEGVDPLAEAGARPDLGTVWVGAWTRGVEWRTVERALTGLPQRNVTPVVQFWYWGDSLRPACLEGGCDGRTPQGWDQVTQELTTRLETHAGGGRVIVVLEPEFNKARLGDSEALDALLAMKAREIEEAYPPAVVVLGFGSWGEGDWATFDRAAEASTWVGIQSLHASTRSTPAAYLAASASTLEGADRLHRLFGKPVLVTDVGLSSHPGGEWEAHQAEALRGFFEDQEAWRGAGVVGIVYRSYHDDPALAVNNHFGRAEGQWGLVHVDGTPKPAHTVWVNGVEEARGGRGTLPFPTGPAMDPGASASGAAGPGTTGGDRGALDAVFVITVAGALVAAAALNRLVRLRRS